MKYSRNPVTGIMESYTDDGVFVGNVITFGDIAMSDKSANDGGPGSGNFGHSGRPGEVGGSSSEGGSGISDDVRKAAANALNYADFWMMLPEHEQSKLKSSEEIKDLYEKAKVGSEHLQMPEWKEPNGSVSDMPKKIKIPDKLPEIDLVRDPDDTATAHAGETGKIQINLAKMDKDSIEYVMAHEAAHQLSNNDPALQEAIIMNYGNVFGRYNQKKGYFDGLVGNSSPEEAFADGLSYYVNYPDHLKKHHPEAYGFFDGLIKNQPGIRDYVNGVIEKAKEMMTAKDGGPGSGNFGHAGRPGKRGGSSKGSGSSESSKSTSSSEYVKKLNAERADVLSRDQADQALFADEHGIADRETCVDAMRNGTASDLVNQYFDIMEKNGDPTPTKPLRKSPDMWKEIEVPSGDTFSTGDWDGTRLRIMKEWTGMSDEEAKAAYKELRTWFSGSWSHADTNVIDDYIDRDGTYDGEIYRGLKFSAPEYDEFMNGLTKGSTIRMKGMNSSWSTEFEDAHNFSKSEKPVIIKCVKNKTSAPVDHLSSHGENEVIAHSKAQWTVLNVQKGYRSTIITVVESEHRMSDEDRSKLREKNHVQAMDSEPDREKRLVEQQKNFEVIPPDEELRRKLFGDIAQDGGPGSGNFGHAGRPGKVGGSGPGGGKQYRGGRAEIGYFGSRKDWLNGLQGEKQHEAARFLAEKKREQKESLDRVKKIENTFERGMITRSEADDMIERLGMKGVNEDTPVEVYVLQKNDERDVHDMLNFAHESRNWPENYDKLMNANLTEEERKVFDYTQGTSDPTNKKIFRSIYAKALGIPHKDVEIPEELLYASGAKERPKSPYDWYRKIRSHAYSNIEGNMSSIIGEPMWGYGWGGNSADKFADLNKRFLTHMKYERLSPTKCIQSLNTMTGLRRLVSAEYNEKNKYLDNKDFEYGEEYANNLTSEEQQKLLKLVNSFTGLPGEGDKFDSLEDIKEEDYHNAEQAMMMMDLRTKEDWQYVRDYVELMDKMLTGETPSETNPVEERKKAEKEEAERKAAEKAKETAEWVQKRDNEQAYFKSSPAYARKQSALKAVRDTTPEMIKTMSRAELTKFANSIMRDGETFITVPQIPDEYYRGAVLAMRDVIDRFPFLAGEIGGFGDPTDSGIAGCSIYAGYEVDGRRKGSEILLNYTSVSNVERLENLRKKKVEEKWFTPSDEGTPPGYADVCHELGHVLANWLNRRTNPDGWTVTKSKGSSFFETITSVDSAISPMLKKNVLKKFDIGVTDYDKIKDEVSEYGASSSTNKKANQKKNTSKAEEFFAECFSEIMTCKKPRRVAAEFGRQLEEFIKANNITDDITATTQSTRPKVIGL